jgi:hypothetical protein
LALNTVSIVLCNHESQGEIFDTKDEHILQARGHIAQEIRQVVREAEKCLEGMHKEHWSMMQLVHTVIASRATLHILQHKVEMLVHKGFFDNRDRSVASLCEHFAHLASSWSVGY